MATVGFPPDGVEKLPVNSLKNVLLIVLPY
jgi:hypothetical protein